MSSQAAAGFTGKAHVSSHIDWSPYVAGIGIGVLSWIVFVVVATSARQVKKALGEDEIIRMLRAKH